MDHDMNILVIESSPHKKGSSNLLAENFVTGAEEAGIKWKFLTLPVQTCIHVLDAAPVGCLRRASRKMIWKF